MTKYLVLEIKKKNIEQEISNLTAYGLMELD